MLLRIFLSVVPIMSLLGQTANPIDPGLRRRERELAAILRWEILWNDASLGFQVPKDGTAKLAAYLKGNAFWYCSRDLGACTQYRLEAHRGWQRMKSIKHDGDQDDMSSVLRFAGEDPLQLLRSDKTDPRSWHLTVGILWTPTVELSTRDEIVKQYQQMRPAELKGLRDWLRTSLQDTGYRSITIACFAPSDPTVFIYGDRPAEHRGPLVFQVYWDREREEWVFVGMLEREQGPKKFEELRATVQAIACDTIRFKH
jgi:hypothetical protein